MTCFKFKLLLTLLGFFYFAPIAEAGQPSLKFSPSTATIKQYEEFSVDILLDTAGYDVGGAGAKINFDHDRLSINEIIPGQIFADYPALIIDNNNGRLTISGVSASYADLFNGQKVLATIRLTANKSGEAVADFIFQPGSTIDSNVAVTFGNGDILAEVNNLKLDIQESSGGFENLSYAPSPSPNIDASQNGLVKLINRLFAGVNLPIPFPEENTSRQGRPNVNLDPENPLPRMAPVSDPIQIQPVNSKVEYTSSPDNSKWQQILISPEFYLPAAGILLLISFLIWQHKFNNQ